MLAVILGGCAAKDASQSRVPVLPRIDIVSVTLKEPGNGVPVRVDLSTPMTQGQSLVVSVDGETVYAVEVSGDLNILQVDVPLEAGRPAKLTAMLLQDEQVISSATRDDVEMTGSDMALTGAAAFSNRVRTRVRGTRLHVMVDNPMTPFDYAKIITIVTDAGKVLVTASPRLPERPYFGFRFASILKGEVTVEVTDPPSKDALFPGSVQDSSVTTVPQH